MQTVLAVYNWPRDHDRYRRVQRFIDFYFERFEGLQKPPYHPKWKSVNLAANVPGWTRYVVAEERLKQTGGGQGPCPRRAASHPWTVARPAASHACRDGSAEQERMFQQFLEWSRKQGK